MTLLETKINIKTKQNKEKTKKKKGKKTPKNK